MRATTGKLISEEGREEIPSRIIFRVLFSAML